MEVKTNRKLNKSVIKIINKMIAAGITDDAAVKALTVDKMVEIPGLTMPELRKLIEIQKSVTKGSGLFALLIEEDSE